MFAAAPIKECQASSIADLKVFLAEQTEPLVIRGLCVDWPQVMAAKQGSKNALDYLLGLANNAPVRSFSSQAIHQGRYFYNADFSGLNFSQHADNLVSVLQKLARSLTQTDSDSLYMGSTAVEYCAPGFSVKNPLTVTDYNCLTSLWVGNHSQIAAHYDNADNLACVAAVSVRLLCCQRNRSITFTWVHSNLHPQGKRLAWLILITLISAAFHVLKKL